MSIINNNTNRYIKGDHNAICDVCGFKQKASTMELIKKGRQLGLFVCRDTCADKINEQDFIHGRRPDMRPVFPDRPEQPDKFVS